MGTTQIDLQNQFWADVGWFNADQFPMPASADYDRFDDLIRMKQIDDPGAYHEGKAAVANYFSGKGTADKARFTPDRSAPAPGVDNSGQPNFEVAGGRLGFVSGTADFVYSIAKPKKRRIAYSFTYTGDSGNWKAIHLWGMYID
jgi:hypothetical protein